MRNRRKKTPGASVSSEMGNDRDSKTAVAVTPAAALRSRPRLFAALEQAFPVRFHAGESESAASIHFCDNPEGTGTDCQRDGAGPRLLVGDNPGSGARSQTVAFAACGPLDQRLRGLAIADPLDGPSLDSVGDDDVLAVAAGHATWTRSCGPGHIERVGSALPELGADEALRDLLLLRPLATAALVSFLRTIASDGAFTPPEPRAAFLFDDPNLRWRSYGFIDFGRLLEHADEHGYHAAMAMIPLDAGRQHRATVELFRRRGDRLSLVMHGNNHLSQELLRPEDDSEALMIAAQALRRAVDFEARHNLRMDRVMTPPHGMCSANSTRALASLGYDALCAIHPLPWREQAPPERPLSGWDPAEFADGCAVIPRLPLGTAASELALRAFLGQPLVIYGHHGDLADGLEPLAETAAAVNALGDVRWSSLGEIATANSATRRDGPLLRVRPYSHRLRLAIPEGVDSVAVEQPRGDTERLGGWSLNGSAPRPFGTVAELEPGIAKIRLQPTMPVDPAEVPPPTGRRIWPVVRRTATETRDRLRPLLRTGAA